MDEQSLVIKILEEVFPDECDIAGPSNVRHLAAGSRESVRVDGGSSLDMAQVLSELQSVVVILYGSIAIFQSLTRFSQEHVRTADTRESVVQSVPGFADLDPVKRDAIIDRVVDWVNEDPAARVPWSRYRNDEFGPYGNP